MYKLDLRVDTKETAAIERRRIMEQQRQSRIFNARERTIGMDMSALSEQVAERKISENVDKQRQEAFASDLKRTDKVGVILQERHEKDIRKVNESINDYRKEHQRAIDRREFDLYDPDQKKKDLPARVSDEDKRLTTSGMQLFEGEDLMFQQRKKLQQEQTREWAAQQMAEKEKLAKEEEQAQRLYDLKACALDQRAVELATAEYKARKTVNMAQTDYNLALAKEKAAQRQQDKMQEQDNDYMELCNHVHGDLLTENPDVAQSAFGSHRVIQDRWKGMNSSQIEKIKMTQEMQIQERSNKEEKDKALQEEWDRQRVTEAKVGLVLESRESKKQKELALKLAEDNKQLAAEQRTRKDYMKNHVYVNNLGSDYFSQFNTSSR